jgi:hypothetical protein
MFFAFIFLSLVPTYYMGETTESEPELVCRTWFEERNSRFNSGYFGDLFLRKPINNRMHISDKGIKLMAIHLCSRVPPS